MDGENNGKPVENPIKIDDLGVLLIFRKHPDARSGIGPRMDRTSKGKIRGR